TSYTPSPFGRAGLRVAATAEPATSVAMATPSTRFSTAIASFASREISVTTGSSTATAVARTIIHEKNRIGRGASAIKSWTSAVARRLARPASTAYHAVA